MTAVETIGLLVGVIGTSIAVYQAAIINETKKRKNELQYLFAGIHASAVHKQQAWQHQISLLPQPSSAADLNLFQIYIRARDDVAELGNLTSALEGTIDPENSAIVAMMDKYKKIVDKNKEISSETDLKEISKSV
nr:hypothetical protein [uncultured Pseudomonas sp.]